MYSFIPEKKAMTLIEVMIAFMILTIGLVGLVSLYLSVSMAVRQSRERVTATEDMSTVFAHLKGMDLAEIKSRRADPAYWQGFLSCALPEESASVVNLDASDTEWDNDPLTLQVSVQWDDLGNTRMVSGVSKFTEPL
jgi:Tfp pilus assembly protein PilV